MKVLLVDDEPLARARLRSMLAELDNTQVIGEAGNGRQALEQAQKLSPDLVLLDIRMPGMDGLEAARHMAGLKPQPVVVFTTAYDEHALAAFEAHAIDYLLKPVRDERLLAALDKAERLLHSSLPEPAAPVRQAPRSCLSVASRNGIELIEIERIRCFRADQKYVSVFHTQGETLIEESLRNLEAEYPDRFLRIHRNALVARAHIRALNRSADGGYVVSIDDCDLELEVSRRHLADLKQWLKSVQGLRSLDRDDRRN